MKIAFVTPYPPSQVTLNEYGYHLINGFIGKQSVEKIYILTNHLENNSDYEKHKKNELEIIPCWSFDNCFSSLSIAKTIHQLKPDVVIMNLQFMTFGKSKIAAALGLLTPFMCKLIQVPSIVLLHNITETVKLDTIGMASHPIKEKLFLWIGKQLTKLILKADLVGLTISKYVEIIKEKYQVNNVVLLPHGNFDLPERTYVSNADKEINLMAFGKFGTYKKVEVMLDAMTILQQKYPNINFTSTIAGTDNPNVSGYLSSVKTKYTHLKNVQYTGYVAEQDVEKIFKKSTFVVFPYTTTTGSSGILHQSGSYARACVLPKIDDLERVVDEEGYSGAYFKTNDAKSLAETIGKLIENPAERIKIEDANYAAAKGLQMTDLADQYLLHAKNIIHKQKSKIFNVTENNLSVC
ncbi:MAG: glycosyltransferase [Chitinophagaceae bacterium]